MDELKIIYLPPGDLIPYAQNAKLHPPEQVERIANSLKRFGFRKPVVIDENNVIVAGHGAVLAAKRIGLERIPCVRTGDLSEAEVDAYRLADNKTNEGDYDFTLLEQELDRLGEMDLDFDMAEFGFDENITGGGYNPLDVQEDETDLTPPEKPVTILGDIYQLGRHRLMCGDSTDAAAWARLMEGEKADMVFTDPPYGVAIGDKNKTLQSVQKAGRIVDNIENDTLSEEELYEMLKNAFVNVRENCADDAVYFVTSPQGGSLGLMMMMMMRDAGLEVRHILTWVKNSPTFSIGRLDYDYQHEPIFYTWTKTHHNFRKGKFRSTIWEVDKPRKCDLHPTMKPVELVANAIMDGTEENMIVLDAFGGSGTTLIAAEQLDRRARVMELDPKYCDVIVRRWEELTGQKAVRITPANNPAP